MWTNARHLAGYEQQDAHEFFIAALDVLHQNCKGILLSFSYTNFVHQVQQDYFHFIEDSDSSSQSENSHQCKCIIDRIFTGGLQSQLKCQVCNSVSTTIDPFWDISLDLGNSLNNNSGKTSSFINSTGSVPSPTPSGGCLDNLSIRSILFIIDVSCFFYYSRWLFIVVYSSWCGSVGWEFCTKFFNWVP